MKIKLKTKSKTKSKTKTKTKTKDKPTRKARDLKASVKDILRLHKEKTREQSMDDLGTPFKWDIYTHGLSQSMISVFRKCERKFRLSTAGYETMGDSLPLIYGSVFHEALDMAQNEIKSGRVRRYDRFNWPEIIERLETFYADDIDKASPRGREFYEMSIGWAEVTLPLYFEYWKTDFFGKTKLDFIEIEKEFIFNMPSTLTKGLSIPVRGKRDGVVKLKGNLWLWENKTKGNWNENTLGQVVRRDLQNNTYLKGVISEYKGDTVKGVIYNLIRRPQLRRKVSESLHDFIERCKLDIASRPEFYFMRLKCPVSRKRQKRFTRQLTRQLALIELWAVNILPNRKLDIENTGECVALYGACSYLGVCDSDYKDFSGLRLKDKLFPELEKANKVKGAKR